MALPALLLVSAAALQGSGQREPNVNNDPTRALVPPRAWQRRWSDDEDLESLSDLIEPSAPFEIHGYLRTSYIHSDDVNSAPGNQVDAFSMDGLRLFVRSEVGDWRFHATLRGDERVDTGSFGIADTLGDFRMPEIWGMYEVFDEVYLRVGRFRPPFLTSGLQEENTMLFYNRAWMGTEWAFSDEGVALDGQFGPLRGWLAVQDGNDDNANHVAITARGAWDILGGGVHQQYDGARDPKRDLALTVAAAIYYDTEDNNFSSQAAEARVSWGRFFAGAEVTDRGDGFGSLLYWSGFASFMITKDLEIAAGFDDFERSDRTEAWRGSLSYYFIGNNAKLQLVYTDSTSNAPLAAGQTVLLGLTTGF
jgi:hypothetical protein